MAAWDLALLPKEAREFQIKIMVSQCPKELNLRKCDGVVLKSPEFNLFLDHGGILDDKFNLWSYLN